MTARRWITIVIVGGVVCLLLAVLGMLPAPLVFVGYLLVGWIDYLRRVFPQITVDRTTLFTGVVCFVGVLILGHLLGRWLWRETQGGRWRLRWTLACTAGVVLMFAAGIGAVGLEHQSAWLARSEQPLFTRNRKAANQIRCASNLRQIGHALEEYASVHGGVLPGDFADLIRTGTVIPHIFVCPATYTSQAPGTAEEQARHLHEGHCDYVYHGAGLVLPLRKDLPIVAEPLFNHDAEGMHILFGDGSVGFVSPADAALLLRQSRRASSPVEGTP